MIYSSSRSSTLRPPGTGVLALRPPPVGAWFNSTLKDYIEAPQSPGSRQYVAMAKVGHWKAMVLEDIKRLEEAGVAVPPADDNGEMPNLRLAPQQAALAIRILREIQEGQGMPPAQSEAQRGDVLDEIWDADEITELMQTRFWGYVRQVGLAPDACQAIQSFVESLPEPKFKKLINDYLLGDDISFDVSMVNGKAMATTTLQHSIFPGLFRSGYSDRAMSLLTPIEIWVNTVYQTSQTAENPSLINRVFWILTAWRAQLNGSAKVLAVKGDVATLVRLFGMSWSFILTPLDNFTSAMWAFWYNQPAAAQFLMTMVDVVEELTPDLLDLHVELQKWVSLEAGDAKEELRRTILAEKASTFKLGFFATEFPLASRLLDSHTDESREATLDAMEKQLIFSLPGLD
ncbi:hypothetical protein H4R33_006910 [Dimargaris cristalligena]|nr:hypothetical protein H4R33_006910 [Dimargaris cristalligena]